MCDCTSDLAALVVPLTVLNFVGSIFGVVLASCANKLFRNKPLDAVIEEKLNEENSNDRCPLLNGKCGDVIGNSIVYGAYDNVKDNDEDLIAAVRSAKNDDVMESHNVRKSIPATENKINVINVDGIDVLCVDMTKKKNESQEKFAKLEEMYKSGKVTKETINLILSLKENIQNGEILTNGRGDEAIKMLDDINAMWSKCDIKQEDLLSMCPKDLSNAITNFMADCADGKIDKHSVNNRLDELKTALYPSITESGKTFINDYFDRALKVINVSKPIEVNKSKETNNSYNDFAGKLLQMYFTKQSQDHKEFFTILREFIIDSDTVDTSKDESLFLVNDFEAFVDKIGINKIKEIYSPILNVAYKNIFAKFGLCLMSNADSKTINDVFDNIKSMVQDIAIKEKQSDDKDRQEFGILLERAVNIGEKIKQEQEDRKKFVSNVMSKIDEKIVESKNKPDNIISVFNDCSKNFSSPEPEKCYKDALNSILPEISKQWDNKDVETVKNIFDRPEMMTIMGNAANMVSSDKGLGNLFTYLTCEFTKLIPQKVNEGEMLVKTLDDLKK